MSHRIAIPYSQARRLVKAKGAPHGWRDIAAEFAGEVWPHVTPSFTIRAGDVVFTMGSCFARNIETNLSLLGCRVPMQDLDLPPSEWSGGVHGAMNRFHPPAFRQTLEWTAKIYDRDGQVQWTDCQDIAFDCGNGSFFDLDMGATAPVSQERFLERRQHIYDIFSNVFASSCLMMTPGLIEAWRDRATGLYIHNVPKHKFLLADVDRWELEVLPYETCLHDLLQAIDVVRKRNPGVKVLLTTSPVPLTSTFTGQDVRIANSYSKSVLRAVCGAATFARPLVDYFPSYESVTLSFPRGVWKDDHLHVAHGFIAKIVTRMLEFYLDGVDDADRACQRARMLLLSGRYAECEQNARAALEGRPGHVDARALLAEALTHQGKGVEAEVELTALLEQHPRRPELWLALARAIASTGGARGPEAIRHVETAIALPGVGLQDLRTVAQVVRKRAEPATAEHIARRMIELFPLHVESYQLLVNVLIDQRRRTEAMELLRRAVKLRRTPLDMYVQLGSLLCKAGHHEEGLAHLRTARQIDPDHPKVRSLLQRLSLESAEVSASAA